MLLQAGSEEGKNLNLFNCHHRMAIEMEAGEIWRLHLKGGEEDLESNRAWLFQASNFESFNFRFQFRSRIRFRSLSSRRDNSKRRADVLIAN